MDFLTKSGAACPRVLKPKPVLPASIICNGLPRSPRGGAVAHWARAVRPRPGGAVLSKAARPKSVAPVSLAGFKPPAAAADPWRGPLKAKPVSNHHDNRTPHVPARRSDAATFYHHCSRRQRCQCRRPDRSRHGPTHPCGRHHPAGKPRTPRRYPCARRCACQPHRRPGGQRGSGSHVDRLGSAEPAARQPEGAAALDQARGRLPRQGHRAIVASLDDGRRRFRGRTDRGRGRCDRYRGRTPHLGHVFAQI